MKIRGVRQHLTKRQDDFEHCELFSVAKLKKNQQKPILFCFIVYTLSKSFQSINSNQIVWFIPFLGFIEEATFMLSKRGQFKLIHNGFDYLKMSYAKSSGITAWRCRHNLSYPHLKCRARAHTKECGQIQKVKLLGTHTHSVDFGNKRTPKSVQK